MEKLLPYCLSVLLLCIGCSPEKEAKRAMHFAKHKSQGSNDYINAYARAIELDSTLDAAYREMSVPYLKLGMPQNWKPLIQKAVALNPKLHIPDRGYLYLWFYRDYKKAIADFNASDTLTPNFTDHPFGSSVHYWRGLCYLGLEDPKEAIRWLDAYIEEETQANGEEWVEIEAFLFRGISYYDLSNYSEAMRNFNKVLAYGNNQYADAKYYKAAILLKQSKLKEAKQFALEALADFKKGQYNYRPYVESMRQLYTEDYKGLLNTINAHEQ
ncbi:MAG: tetratricopeptide repeat protein [Flavobacteriaceae bacterium]|nr:tetratricopeptide repeat protein [Flavobacteriaceae bacterium]